MTSQAAQAEGLVDQMLARISASSPAAEKNEQATDYDWTRPHAFMPAQLERLKTVSNRAAEAIAAALENTLGRTSEITAAELEQIYAADAFGQESDNAMQWAMLGDADGRTRGALGIKPENASAWVAKLLGGEPSEGRTMSALELEILADLFETVAAAFNSALNEEGVDTLQCDSHAAENVAGSFEPSEEMLVFVYNEGDDEIARFILSSGFIQQRPDGQNESPQQIKQQIIDALENVIISAEVFLGTVQLTLREAANISPGDLLITNTCAGQPIYLTSDDKPILAGYPARFKDSYALKVTNWTSPSGEQKTSPNK